MKKSLSFCLFFLLILVSSCGQKKEENINEISAEEVIQTEVSPDTNESPVSTEQTESTEADSPSSVLEVHFIDVGQGDSTLIICDGEAMLIDGGNNNKGTTVQLYLKKQEVSELKYLVATHPDADHIGGLDVIVTKFNIETGTVLMPDVVNDTPTYGELLDAIDYRGYRCEAPIKGTAFKLGAADVLIAGPGEEYANINDNSIIVKVSLGDTSFLFTGDAGEASENSIEDIYLDGVDVIKAGHHGSKSSTSESFINRFKPQYAVISCGKDNDYGHPSRECLDVLKNAGVLIFRTDEQGSIVAVSDGKTITWNTDPSVSWESGIEKTDGGSAESEFREPGPDITYVVNTNSNIFHRPDCESVGKMKEKNRTDVTFTCEELMAMGIKPCGACRPDQQ